MCQRGLTFYLSSKYGIFDNIFGRTQFQIFFMVFFPLNVQMRSVCSQLTKFKAEVSRLTDAQTSAEDEWSSERGRLQSELSQATAEKVTHRRLIGVVSSYICYTPVIHNCIILNESYMFFVFCVQII